MQRPIETYEAWLSPHLEPQAFESLGPGLIAPLASVHMRIGRKWSTVSAILTLAFLSLHCGSSGGHSMLISGPKIFIAALGLFAIFGLSQIIPEQCADARAGGGRS